MNNWLVLKDNNGHFGGNVMILANSPSGKGDYEWIYSCENYPTHGCGFKENLKIELAKLQEINSLAEYPLTWEIVELTWDESLEMRKKFLQHKKDYDNSIYDEKPIKYGMVGKTKKALREICKKYNAIPRRRIA